MIWQTGFSNMKLDRPLSPADVPTSPPGTTASRRHFRMSEVSLSNLNSRGKAQSSCEHVAPDVIGRIVAMQLSYALCSSSGDSWKELTT